MEALTGRWLGWVVLGMTLASVGIGVKTSVDRADDARCLTRYVAENSRVTKIRAAANAQTDNATSELLSAVSKLVLGKPSPDASAKFRAAFVKYDHATEAAAEDRKNNPLPNLPTSCSEVA